MLSYLDKPYLGRVLLNAAAPAPEDLQHRASCLGETPATENRHIMSVKKEVSTNMSHNMIRKLTLTSLEGSKASDGFEGSNSACDLTFPL